MRRKRSDELPRYAGEHSLQPSIRWRRRYGLYLAAFILFCWIVIPGHARHGEDSVNWKKYAYSLYATDSATLCHALLVVSKLHEFGSRADRVLFYPKYWDTDISDARDRDSQLLVMARDKFKVKLHPVTLLGVQGRTKDTWTGTWDKSLTKLMGFTLVDYERVIALDSDITLLSSLDELFKLPQTPIAMPRAYWFQSLPRPLTSLLMVIKPDMEEYERFRTIIKDGGNDKLVTAHRFDMELLNDRFEESAMVLPHRPYALLSGEFRSHNHSAYLGSAFEKWDAEKVLKEAKLVHFSDWPLPKPWIMWPQEGLAEMQPDCGGSHEGTCAERKLWKHLYEDFRQRRKDICRLLSVPAPEWATIKGTATKGKAQAPDAANNTSDPVPEAQAAPQAED